MGVLVAGQDPTSPPTAKNAISLFQGSPCQRVIILKAFRETEGVLAEKHETEKHEKRPQGT